MPFFKKKINSGQEAEIRAKKHLQDQGLKCLTQNYRSRYGEIDLVMQDKDNIVFVEVRLRNNNQFGSALETVDRKKQEKIQITAQAYMSEHTLYQTHAMRFDVVGFDKHQVQWIKGAF